MHGNYRCRAIKMSVIKIGSYLADKLIGQVIDLRVVYITVVRVLSKNKLQKQKAE